MWIRGKRKPATRDVKKGNRGKVPKWKRREEVEE